MQCFITSYAFFISGGGPDYRQGCMQLSILQAVTSSKGAVTISLFSIGNISQYPEEPTELPTKYLLRF
jgi:hypothetical protein